MKLSLHEAMELDALQKEFNLSSSQVARMAFKRFGKKITRQCAWHRLNGITLNSALINDQNQMKS